MCSGCRCTEGYVLGVWIGVCRKYAPWGVRMSMYGVCKGFCVYWGVCTEASMCGVCMHYVCRGENVLEDECPGCLNGMCPGCVYMAEHVL